MVTEVATMGAQEVHVRHKYNRLHKREDKEDTIEDEDDNADEGSDSEKETKISDDEKSDGKTKSADGNEDEDEDEDEQTTKSVAPTKVISVDLDDIVTRPLSVATSASPTPTSIDPDSPLPSPFDGTTQSEFKTSDGDDSCPDYIRRLLSSPTFNDCHPLSMLVTVRPSECDTWGSVLTTTLEIRQLL